MNPPPTAPVPSHAARPRRLGLITLLLVVLAGVVVAGSRLWRKAPAPPAMDPFPLMSVSSSPFLNTRSDVRYVGSEACRLCHMSHDASFRRTGMGRSMAEVDPAREPPDAAYDHPPSKRRYQVVRRDGRLWHRELLLTVGAGEVVLSEFPVRYVVGSGHHSRTYLVEVDGFLVESPVTWYTARQAWGMSPGYDTPYHNGFERAVGEGCLFCHAGQAKTVGNSLHRMHVAEPAISCEQCHGPGELHVALQSDRDRLADALLQKIDYTIVNPAHLSRELSEAICQQCHLRSSALVAARGRKVTDFRPGLPLQDFRHDYVLDMPDAPMTVVGHVEQMHLSRCYQASDTLTCLSCHDPHGEPPPQERQQYYKAICLRCHEEAHCTVDARRRQQESPDNDCVRCHMPRSPTEIPHLAFTHHRIGIHAKAPAARSETGQPQHGPGVLRPFLDLSRLSDIDRKRSLGLGYLETANREKNDALTASYQKRALDLLAEVRSSGLRDAALEAALARLCFDLKLDGVSEHAQSALALPGLDAQDHCNALFLLADAHAREGRHADAVAVLRRLTGLRRHSVDWLLLADCEHALGNPAAVECLETAVRINPRLSHVHQYLARHYRRQGNPERADWHERRAGPE